MRIPNLLAAVVLASGVLACSSAPMVKSQAYAKLPNHRTMEFDMPTTWKAIEATFPKAWVQTCVVHLIRASLRYVDYRDKKKVASALRPIYTALTHCPVNARARESDRRGHA